MYHTIDVIAARVNYFLMLFGIVGNSLCMCVLVQKKLLGHRFNCYLLVLALVDLVFSTVVFANYSVMYTNPNRALFDLNKVACYFTDYFVHAIDSFCVIITLIVSLDRFYAIIKPIRLRSLFTNRYPKQISAACFLALLLVHLPEVFLNEREYIYASSSLLNPPNSAALIPPFYNFR